jgi:hypothetical protein
LSEMAETAFGIAFTDEPLEYLGEDSTAAAAVGAIWADDLNETILCHLNPWDQATYEAQWLAALGALLAGKRKAALITSYVGADSNRMMWCLFRGEGEVVYIQNHMVFGESLKEPFSVECASDLLDERRILDQDGQRISEWTTTLSAIARFVQREVP